MKYVQMGILVCLVVIAGLLFAIYSLKDEPVEPDEMAQVERHDTPEVAMAQGGDAEPTAKAKPTRPPAEPLPTSPSAPSEPAAPKESKARPRPVGPPPPPVGEEPEREPPTAEPVEDPPAREQPPARSPQPFAAISEPAPPARPEPQRVTLPSGMDLVVRLDTVLSSETNYPGDVFYATLDEPIIFEDFVIAQRGARVEGEVFEVQRAGRVKGTSKLGLKLVALDTADGQTIEIETNQTLREGQKSTKEDAAKVGLGAAIGAFAGGGKGAAIGAGAGAGAGGGAVLVTRGKPVRIPAETRLWFRLTDSVEVVESL